MLDAEEARANAIAASLKKMEGWQDIYSSAVKLVVDETMKSGNPKHAIRFEYLEGRWLNLGNRWQAGACIRQFKKDGYFVHESNTGITVKASE